MIKKENMKTAAWTMEAMAVKLLYQPRCFFTKRFALREAYLIAALRRDFNLNHQESLAEQGGG
ncbi:MAG: hypothetical protein LUI07_04310, partial [Lachnospiraceae bacterium]|nr:hypothetical protein [Lachnospiraceae bacterium]